MRKRSNGTRAVSEHRTGRRFSMNLPIEFQLAETGAKQKGTTRDLSASGVYISAPAPFQVGSEVRFQISVPGELLGTKKMVGIEGRGRVIRVDKGRGAGKAKTNTENGVACVIDTYRFVRKG